MTRIPPPINLQKSKEPPYKWIVKLDATAISSSTCFKRFWLNTIGGYRDALFPNDMEFGTAFHIFAHEVQRTKGNIPFALGKAQEYYSQQPKFCKEKKEYLTKEYLAQVCTRYWTDVMSKDSLTTVEVNGVPLVEQNFAIPLTVTDSAEYLLGGTIDRIVRTGNSGRVSILDYKSTGKYAKSSDQFFLEKELSTQLLCYTVGARYLGQVAKNPELQTILEYTPSCLIEGIFIPSGVTIEFKRSKYITFTQDQISEWMSMLNDLVREIDLVFSGERNLIRDGMFNGACGGGYSLCKYFRVCCCPDAIASQHILNREFVTIQYDPLNHGKLRSMEDFAKMKAGVS